MSSSHGGTHQMGTNSTAMPSSHRRPAGSMPWGSGTVGLILDLPGSLGIHTECPLPAAPFPGSCCITLAVLSAPTLGLTAGIAQARAESSLQDRQL